MTRFIIEELCQHGADQPHHDGTGRRDVVLHCWVVLVWCLMGYPKK